MNQKMRPDLKEIIRLGGTGQVYMEHFEQWQRFKEQWSEEDRAHWRSLLGRLHKGRDGTAELNPPLSRLEKQWARDFVRRAESLNLC
jgi:hypothetical protein